MFEVSISSIPTKICSASPGALMAIQKIIKRNGDVVKFDKRKITYAIFKAAQAVGGTDKKLAEELAEKVVRLLETQSSDISIDDVPSVEDVQDVVEKVLIENGNAKTAKAYILYRQERSEIRKEKARVLEKTEIDEVDKVFDLNALRVLKSRYLNKDETGRLTETPKELFTRIAVHDAMPHLLYDQRFFNKNCSEKVHEHEEFHPDEYHNLSIGKYKLNQYHLEALKRMYDRFNREGKMKVGWSIFFETLKNKGLDRYEKEISEYYSLMVEKKFMPNTPAIANFGTSIGMGSACYVLNVGDSMEEIMDTLKATAMIHKAGGGTGFNFSYLRPEGDFISSTKGTSSGPLSFMRLFDTMTEVVKQGGIRRGANMGIMNSNHPDIEKFISAKEGNKALRNFNISVLIMDDFWNYLENNEPYPLINPRNGEVVRYINPAMLFDRLVYQAWESAEPGVIFYDTVNKYNPFYETLGPIVTTNPCVSSDTLVSTENGLEQIDKMKTLRITVDAGSIESGALKQRGCLQTSALQIVKTGTKDVYTLTTQSGYEVTATADHKILTDTGWKELGKITSKDSVLLQSGGGTFNKNTRLPFDVENSVHAENGRIYSYNLPAEWSRDLGLVLGWMTGDGFLSENNITALVFAQEDEELRRIIQPVFENYCNRKINITNDESPCIQIRSASRHVVEFFKKLGVTTSKQERRVPHTVFTATEEAVRGFLQGLFSSDGTIATGSKSRNYIRLNSSSVKLLRDVQLLLLNTGIRSSIYDRSTQPKKFKYLNKNGEVVIYTTTGTNYELNIAKENIPRFLERVGFIGNKHASKIERLKQFTYYREYFLDTVKSIVYSGKREVWDITEPRTRSFIANGIVVHNCGEVLLYPNEPCNLGSINVWAFATEDEDGNVNYDWNGLAKATRTAARFLDNVIDVNKWPLKQIEDMALATRKIGLGVMGVGDLLYQLQIPYNSEEGRVFMGKLMEFINYHSKLESVALAQTRGALPYYDKSFYIKGMLPVAGFEDADSWNFDWSALADNAKAGIRNGFTTVIAPTGSISMIAGCSSGIEPVYSLVFEKNVKVGSFYYVNPVFEKVMKKEGLFDEKLMEDVLANNSSVHKINYIPERLRRIFVTAMDITPENHVRAQAAFQKWTDSSISKTNNFPANASTDNIRESYLLAHKLGCKGITVYRDSSIKEQVLVAATKESEKKVATAQQDYETQRASERLKKEPMKAHIKEPQPVKINATVLESAKPTICPECNIELHMKEGCVSCPDCGWGMCS